MLARTKFVMGAGLITVSVGYLMASGIKDTGVYFVTPTELAEKVKADPSIHDVGVRMGARVVSGSIMRDVADQTITFEVTSRAASCRMGRSGPPLCWPSAVPVTRHSQRPER
jgi:cytochrome c-type biogenesis protein CcmE